MHFLNKFNLNLFKVLFFMFPYVILIAKDNSFYCIMLQTYIVLSISYNIVIYSSHTKDRLLN